jgi:hypothetical protein
MFFGKMWREFQAAARDYVLIFKIFVADAFISQVYSQPVKNKQSPNLVNLPVQSRVGRRYVFKPKIPIWVNLGGP